jgi:carboxylesterase
VIVPALIGAVALIGAAGRWYRRSVANAIRDRFDRTPEGIIRGAESIHRQGTNGAAILLVHGGGDTPQTLGHVADAFSGEGYSVSAPLLPGHGRDLAAFDQHDADEWYATVQREFEALRATHSWVGVVGLSMGGALSARLAAETQAVDALVLASPYLSLPSAGALLAQTAPVWGVLFPVIPTASNRSVLDPSARAVSLGYGALTYRALRALQLTASRGFAALPRVTAPTLVVQSTTDNRISTPATQRAFDHLGAPEKKLEWIEGAGHVITVDYGWEKLVARVVDWMDSHRAKNKAGHLEGAPPVGRERT